MAKAGWEGLTHRATASRSRWDAALPKGCGLRCA
jgi:hypothetical protein